MDENLWIKKFFKLDLESPTLNEIESIKNFALLWNMFERYFCRKNANLENIKNNLFELDAKGYSFPESLSTDFFEFFKDRYVTNNQTNALFENLGFREGNSDKKYKILLKSILEDNSSEIKDKILANFIIIYRFRNNLFHGSKDIATISQQKVNFEIANKIIMIFLDFLKRSGKLLE